jgi:hypothetical protein
MEEDVKYFCEWKTTSNIKTRKTSSNILTWKAISNNSWQSLAQLCPSFLFLLLLSFSISPEDTFFPERVILWTWTPK